MRATCHVLAAEPGSISSRFVWFCPGRGKVLLDGGDISHGEGKASHIFFHIKCDICMEMTQAGSHHPCRGGGRTSTRTGWVGPAGLCSVTRAQQGGVQGVIMDLNQPVPDTMEFRAVIALLGVGGTCCACRGCDGCRRLHWLRCCGSCQPCALSCSPQLLLQHRGVPAPSR